MHAHGCLEPEVLAAYVDHGLSLVERGRAEAHLASCPQCTALLAGVVRTAAEIAPALPHTAEPTEATPMVWRRVVANAAAAAAAVIAVLAAPSVMAPWLDRDAALVSLAGSVGEQRSVLGRLTGGYPHAPLDAASAGGQDARASGADRVLLTAGRIRESVGEMATPSRMHALGVSQLLEGRYDDAAQLLLAASREQPANARYLTDVATVHLERARLGLRPDDLPRALAAADRARRLDPSLNEAWFNRALAMSALQLTEQAKSAWAEYLRRDSSSPWAGEARKRLEDLSKPTPAAAWAEIESRLHQQIDAATADEAVRTQTTEARQFIENLLLIEWANAVLAGHDGAGTLERARVMGEAMRRVAGDSLYQDAVIAIDRANGLGQPQSRALASAHRAYAEASSLLVNDRFVEAEPRLNLASQSLSDAGSPLSHRAAIDWVGALYITNRYDQALAQLRAAKIAARTQGYSYVAGRASWFEGMIAFAQSRLPDARAHYEDTLATFERMGDAEQVVSGHGLLASLYFYLGDKHNEWKHREPMLAGLSVSRSVRLKYAVMSTAALSVREENPEAALSIQDLVVQFAEESERPAVVIEALAQRSTILMRLGRVADAARSIGEARARLQRVADPALKQLIELIVLGPESELHRDSNPAASAASARRGLEIIQMRNSRADRSRLPQFQLQLAKANIALGNLRDAERALAAGIQAFDAERAAISDEGRFSADDENWGLFETGVQLAIKQGDLERAFAMSERARARTLAEARTAQAPRSLTEVQSSLAPGDLVVSLNQFDNELAIWAISREQLIVKTRPLTRLDASRLIAKQQQEIWREAITTTAGEELYDAIVRPIASQIAHATKVVFVPDATFEDASFAALWNSSKRRFLVEELIVVLAPNVEGYIAATSSTTAPPSRTSLIVGGPSLRAEAGARAVAALYDRAAVLTGAEATSHRLLSELAEHEIIHVAAETSSSDTHPLLSRILLADEPGRQYSGAVLGAEIAARPLPHTRLVVLDEVKGSNTDRGEGTLKLVRAFMTAGVPAVVGTLPGIDETAARDLMIGFHREMSNGIPAEQALSTVQRNAIQQNGRRLGAWTALVLYGSDR